MNGIDYLKLAGLSPDQIDYLENELGYEKAPASRSHHLAVPGGLVAHSTNVACRLAILSAALDVKWSRRESPYLVGMLHDLVKTKCYRVASDTAQDGTTYEYVNPGWPGHGEASVMIATVEAGIRLNADEAAAIRWHMGCFGLSQNEYKDFNNALERHAGQIIATHCADWYAARVDEEGKFSI